MAVPPHRLFSLLLALAFPVPTGARAQDPPEKTPPPAATPATAPVRLLVSRRTVKNFLTDTEALSVYPKGGEGLADLQGLFAIGSAETGRAILWDPTSCRLLGILLLPGSSAPAGAEPQYLLKASGALPILKTAGASGTPRYFGFRIVSGIPEFLYTLGSLSIEESIWLEEDGSVLKQRFKVSPAARGLQFTFAPDWKARLSASAGTWKDRTLTVPKESEGVVVLTYRLDPEVPAASGTQP